MAQLVPSTQTQADEKKKTRSWNLLMTLIMSHHSKDHRSLFPNVKFSIFCFKFQILLCPQSISSRRKQYGSSNMGMFLGVAKRTLAVWTRTTIKGSIKGPFYWPLTGPHRVPWCLPTAACSDPIQPLALPPLAPAALSHSSLSQVSATQTPGDLSQGASSVEAFLAARPWHSCSISQSLLSTVAKISLLQSFRGN